MTSQPKGLYPIFLIYVRIIFFQPQLFYFYQYLLNLEKNFLLIIDDRLTDKIL